MSNIYKGEFQDYLNDPHKMVHRSTEVKSNVCSIVF